MGYDAFYICVLSLASSMVTEAIAWYLIYRTPQYQRIKGHIEKTARALEKKKKEGAIVGPAQAGPQRKEKKLAKLEEDLKTGSRDLTLMKMKSTMFLTVTMMAVFWGLNRWYDGHVVAKLPFHPHPFFQKMSHRGIAGNDPTDCSMPFLFFVAGMGIRTSMSKLFGSEQPRALNNLNPLMEQLKEPEE